MQSNNVKNVNQAALTGVDQLVGHCPTKQKVLGSIAGQGTLPTLQVRALLRAHRRGN